MVHLVNLTPYWKEKTNVIVVHNMNYQNELGLVNIYGEIIYQNGVTEKILSNKSWTAAISADKDWILGNNDYKTLQPVVVGSPPFINGALSYPKFSENIPSHHTYFLGLAGIATRYIPLWMTWLLPKIAKIAFNKGFLF